MTGLPRLALAGGVASNVNATRWIRLLPEVDDLYVFPHMGDGGLAVGAAVAGRGAARIAGGPDLGGLDLGPAYDRRRSRPRCGAPGWKQTRPAFAARVADALADGRRS